MSDEMNMDMEQGSGGRRYVARPKICQFCASWLELSSVPAAWPCCPSLQSPEKISVNPFVEPRGME